MMWWRLKTKCRRRFPLSLKNPCPAAALKLFPNFSPTHAHLNKTSISRHCPSVCCLVQFLSPACLSQVPSQFVCLARQPLFCGVAKSSDSRRQTPVRRRNWQLAHRRQKKRREYGQWPATFGAQVQCPLNFSRGQSRTRTIQFHSSLFLFVYFWMDLWRHLFFFGTFNSSFLNGGSECLSSIFFLQKGIVHSRHHLRFILLKYILGEFKFIFRHVVSFWELWKITIIFALYMYNQSMITWFDFQKIVLISISSSDFDLFTFRTALQICIPK